ncbi:nucleotidyltransferase domain-containing protein [Pseudanabaena sp. Chao 1811]|uniref:nucleotidyltransferase domain-containing protein n=1 Tax=Pseudanabaena sp. Chao 1811 TaxID=2963092 RepID=UPI0022F3E0C0|nr:nucleotidyltransferase [Pseudanabaena sp. Chao 1811]
MGIPEAQLEIWAKYQQPQAAVNTHESIRLALNSKNSPLKLRELSQGNHFEIYLQGSYKNSTNIRADSDVDVVVQLNTTFCSNKSELPPLDRIIYSSTFSDATYSWNDFRNDILNALQSYYSISNVVSGNKSIKLVKGSNRLAADIVPCIQYRNYRQFKSSSEAFIEGMTLYTQNEWRKVINYPKHHYQNGINKHTATNKCFKPMVRIFKNARNILKNARIISDNCAPSYFIECLLYNVPDKCFRASYQENYLAILTYLFEYSINSFVCQNRQIYLFGNTPEQWSTQNAFLLMKGYLELWKAW